MPSITVTKLILLLLGLTTLSIDSLGINSGATNSRGDVLQLQATPPRGTGYSSTKGYSRIVEMPSLWDRMFPPVDPGRAHLMEAGRLMGSSKKRRLRNPLRKLRKKKPGTLILVRNGESQANYTTFAGWDDPEVSDKGLREVQHAGRLLREAGYDPDIVFTSRLKRAIHSSWAILREMDTVYLPVYKSWRLNGRHYGSLTGLSKAQVAETFGAEQVQEWRNDPTIRPPPMAETDPFWTANERKFADVKEIPTSESIVDCMKRIEPLWKNKIQAELNAGHTVLVVGHATTLRGIIKYVQGIDDDRINIDIPPGIPLVYEFDKNLEAIRKEGSTTNELWATFLEKPGLLQKALEAEQSRVKNVPGYKALDAGTSRPMNSLEQSLTKLSAERDLWTDENDGGEALAATADSTKMTTDGQNSKNIGQLSKAKVQLISQHPCLAPLPTGVQMPKSLSKDLPSRKGATIVMVRHGKTEHNKLGLFTGWQDAPLAPEGVDEARAAGKLLQSYGFEFDVVYTSWLSRAIDTAWLILDELDSTWLPIVKSWRLNERAYGALTGKSKKMVARMVGEVQFKKWRRGYKVRPPPLHSFSPDFPGNDVRYQKFLTDVRYSFSESLIRSIAYRKPLWVRKFPKTESLYDCNQRTIPFLVHNILPTAMEQRVLIASSENAIRGILMYLCDIPEDRIAQLSIPNGVPIIYDVPSRTVKLIQEEEGVDPLEKYDFGDAAEFLFRDNSGATDAEDVESNDSDEECDVDNISDESMAELNKLYGEAAENEALSATQIIGT